MEKNKGYPAPTRGLCQASTQLNLRYGQYNVLLDADHAETVQMLYPLMRQI